MDFPASDVGVVEDMGDVEDDSPSCEAKIRRIPETAESSEQLAHDLDAYAVDQLMHLGSAKVYVDCAFGCGKHSKLIMQRLASPGCIKILESNESAFEAARELVKTDAANGSEVFCQTFGNLSMAIKQPVAGILLDLGSSKMPFLQNDADKSGALARSLPNFSAKEIAWAIDTFGLRDPLLAERIAEAVLQCPVPTDAQTFSLHLADTLEKFQDESTHVDLRPLINLALHVFLNREDRQLEQLLGDVLHLLEPSGRCVIITYNRWELACLRKFLLESEEPDDCLSSTLQPERLAQLFPLLSSDRSFTVRRVAPLMQGICEDALQEGGMRLRMVHVLEKQCRRVTTPVFGADRASVIYHAIDARQRLQEPPLPIFGTSGTETPEEHSLQSQSVDTGMEESKMRELEELKSSIAARKAQLMKEGQSSKQSKKDAQIADWVQRMNELHRDDPGHAEKVQARCCARHHVSVLLTEAVDHVTALGPAKLYVDCTFGRGGHTELLLSKISAHGRVKAFDVDPSAVQAGRALEGSDSRFEIIHRPFGDLSLAVQEPIAGILLDLGVSSPQLDDKKRGFSFKNKKDGPFDLRMNQHVGLPAWQWLLTVDAAQLAWVIDRSLTQLEPLLIERIAEAIIGRQRRFGPYKTTLQLASFLKDVESSLQDEHPGLDLTRIVFYAIRIFLNQEIEQLERVLHSAIQCLEMFGRCVVISFNRWEAVALNRFLRAHEEPKTHVRRNLRMESLSELYPLLASDKPYAVQRVVRPLRPSSKEIGRNIRSRSSLLHVLEKVPRSP